jgi:hypothetical protein
MEKLNKMNESEYSSFIRVLFGLSSPSPVAADLTQDENVGNLEWFDPTLNDSQKDAIRFALASREVALIHGPPGVSYLSLCRQYSIAPLTYLDRQNSHSYRINSSDDQVGTENSRLWPF